MQEQEKNAGFDFDRDVIGEDLVVSGVVYNSTEWVADAEDGVRRRTETVDGAGDAGRSNEQRLAGDFRQRARGHRHGLREGRREPVHRPHALRPACSRYEHLLSEGRRRGIRPRPHPGSSSTPHSQARHVNLGWGREVTAPTPFRATTPGGKQWTH
ncbi:hypothetical protein F8M49_21960 [Rhodococcus zopfii]|uniref:Uncharacterized protein n=1 Tax=Rhodococcus zopfii TaxID=43772 RepID=A0ABU3WTR5_9NOCA|nr:hypothetical protein [Rhodococcus zopfii]